MISALLLVIITIFFPPVGVYLVAGCGADLFINIVLTILGYIPGHIHAFYIEYIYYSRKEQAQQGYFDERPAPGVYSSNVQTGGTRGYGTIAPPAGGPPPHH
ncbi:Putative proteolipid membrane potential modulator [Septoria linicola]|uniref:Proteolipid membrane potential modulator n=1 Tax=Septoria linicola TaxID=215465 RepID=A0A9Q9EH64_9PEZI|nr:putative proteolipid membrane potential modulator [Septoria linicola]USW51496.1 Putative proteolipid membrane potential modulator [Septoria linicola]